MIMITIAEIKEKAERTKEKIRLEKNIMGMSTSARHEVLTILEKGKYLIPKKLNIFHLQEFVFLLLLYHK